MREQKKGKRRLQKIKTLLEVIKINLLIREVTESVTSYIIYNEGKKIFVVALINLSRIYS